MRTELTALVIDDEFKGRNVLVKLLEHYCPMVEVVGEAEDIASAETMIHKLQPDVLFLDIEMPGGDGFTLLQKFAHPSFHVIFVTSFDHYALRSIRCSALGYLLKPVLVDELVKAVEKARLFKKIGYFPGRELSLLQENQQRSAAQSKLFLNNKTKLEYVIVSEIMYLIADSNYTYIYTRNGKEHLSARTLKEYEEILCQPDMGFWRVHKSGMVNPAHIQTYRVGDVLEIIMSDGERIRVSRRKKQDIIALLVSR